MEPIIFGLKLEKMNFFYTGTLAVIPTFDIDLKITLVKEIVQEIAFNFSLTFDVAQKIIKKLKVFPTIELPIQKDDRNVVIKLKIIAKEELCTILTAETLKSSDQYPNPTEILFDYFSIHKPLMFIDLREYSLDEWSIMETLKERDERLDDDDWKWEWYLPEEKI